MKNYLFAKTSCTEAKESGFSVSGQLETRSLKSSTKLLVRSSIHNLHASKSPLSNQSTNNFLREIAIYSHQIYMKLLKQLDA